MSGFSQSQFLQALGWSTLNSFWQMALLWCGYLAVKYCFKLTANRKYQFAVAAISIGFFWFIATFLAYFNTGYSYNIEVFDSLISSQSFLPAFLTAASVTYLLLFTVPAYRFFKNWQFTQVLRTNGLQKVDVQYKLFVKRISSQIGIRKEVSLYISELIKSPVTIGFIKPIILLPIASINNLTTQQLEAVLLHELSHIKRFDYLVNLLLNIAHTFLYFNPFVKLFLRVAEEERENCCDQMVIQFGYDRVSYASALLTLEKTSAQSHILAICATGKKNLLARIEKIVGMEKKPVLNFNHLAGLVAALLCIFAINSLLITSKENSGKGLAFNNLVNPFYFFDGGDTESSAPEQQIARSPKTVTFKQPLSEATTREDLEVLPPAPPAADQAFINVGLDDVEATLSTDAKEKVKETVETTKKVLATYEWKEIENSIGDGLTKEEKLAAKQEYLREIEKVNWVNLEKNLKAAYDEIDWTKIDSELKNALSVVKLDSIINVYEQTYKELDKAEKEATCSDNNTVTLPFPDESSESVDRKKENLKLCVEALKSLRNSKVIKL